MAALECYDCGRRWDDRKRCECGEPLWFRTDLTDASVDGAEGSGVPGYLDVLPVEGIYGVGEAAGGTPLARAERLDDYAGCTVYLKDESQNPTGSFKDRGSAVGAAYAIENDIDWIGTLSFGNMAMSVAAAAASTSLDCAIFVPPELPEVRYRAIGQYGPRLFQASDIWAVNERLAEIESEFDVEFINADVPLRTAGQKTVAFEIYEQFGAGVPDAIVVPAASGGHASAVWKGLRDLHGAGVIESIPELYPVQAAASDPIAQAYERGDDRVTESEIGETIAVSLKNKAPLSGNRALRAARETGGGVLAIEESAIREAVGRIASHGGVCVEPASAVTLAGVRRLTEWGELDADDEVALILTGTGFKELAGVDPDVSVEEVDADSLETTLEGLTT